MISGMRWLLSTIVLLVATHSVATELPEELRTLEFGFDVESIESDGPMLELQWKYKQHLEELKAGNTDNAEALLAVEAELESLDQPLKTSLSIFPELKRLQEAHRSKFTSLMAERKATLEAVIQHYQGEARKLAESWKKENKLDEATLALEASARFSSHLDRPIKYGEFLEKRAAETEAKSADKSGGPLRAWGVVHGRVPIDISIASQFDDFVATEFHNKGWAAIRQNGEVVSSQPDLNGLENVAQVEMTDRRAYLVYRNGTVGSIPPDPDMPANLRTVKKISVSSRDVLALSENGRIAGWGDSFSNPQLRPPQTLTDVVDIALSWGANTVQGFALRSNGTVSTWGGGPNKVVIPRDLPAISAIDAGWTKLACLTQDGKAIVLDKKGYLQGGLPPKSTKLVSVVARGPLIAAQSDAGKWFAWGSGLMGVSDQILKLENADAITYKMNGSAQGWGALLWIERD